MILSLQLFAFVSYKNIIHVAFHFVCHELIIIWKILGIGNKIIHYLTI